ncbi:DEP domain-containing protein 1A, partial [Armadillidium vulgare]
AEFYLAKRQKLCSFSIWNTNLCRVLNTIITIQMDNFAVFNCQTNNGPNKISTMSITKGKTIVTGPYRATKLWNDAVHSFYNEMPLSRHWRGLKQYDSCFTASEAIDWLHDYLRSNPNFGQNVVREQATKLLRKFVKCGLIIGARGTKIYAEDFRDNRELYKLENQSPLKVLRTPGRTPFGTNNKKKQFTCNTLNENISNEQAESFVSTKVFLSDEKVNEFWKETFFEKLEMLSEQLMVGGDGSSPLLPLSRINATWIRHNMILLKSKSISRTEGLSSSEVLPSWVLSAMNRPNYSSSVCNIPNYPGVEIDIFKVVREFFSEMVVPLIPLELYDPIVRLYIGAEFLDIANRTPGCIANSGKTIDNHHDNSISSIASYDSVEDLILNISAGTNHNANHSKIETGIDILSSNSFDFPEGNNQIHKESRTPVRNVVTNGFSSIPRSLRLNKLNNYTNFKDSYLYTKEEKCSPALSNKCDSFEENISRNRVTLKSLKNRSLSGGKIKEHDCSNSSTSVFKKGLKTEELDNYCLPPNSCFETAFTSDSPRTRVIPQKSVDTIHFRQFSNALRPKSIAVSSLSSQSLVDKVDASRCSSSLSKSTLTDSDSHSGFDRSLSEGNLLKLSSQNLNSAELKKSSNSRSMLATKVRDSIKRKRAKDIKQKRNKSSNTDVEYKDSFDSKNPNCDNLNKPESLNFVVNRMRTKSGGYENPALCLRSFSPETVSSTSSFDVNDFKNTSGGYVNRLYNSKSSLNHSDLKSKETESKSTQTSNVDYTSSASFHCKRFASRCHNDSYDTIHSLISGRSKSATPDGCLSHSLLSARSNSVYLSALSGLDQTSLSYNSFASKSPENLSNHSISPPHLPKREPKVQMNSSEFESFRNTFDHENNTCEKCGHSPKSLSSSANELSDDWVDRTPFGAAPPFVRGGLWKHYYSSPSKRLIEHQSRLLRKVCGRGLLTKIGKEICVELLQLLFLNLEPRVRRKLYLLLKMMNKVSNNDKLQIDNLNTNRALMVKTFARSILLSKKERDYDEMLATRIVTFMMDNFDALFSPPESLAVLVHRKINENSSGSEDTRYKSLLSLHQPITYCRQVTPEAYEKQKLTGSQQFLEELLDQIVDGKMSEKEKKKKLKEVSHNLKKIKKFKSTTM